MRWTENQQDERARGLLLLFAGIWVALQLLLPWSCSLGSEGGKSFTRPTPGYRSGTAVAAVSVASVPLLIGGAVGICAKGFIAGRVRYLISCGVLAGSCMILRLFLSIDNPTFATFGTWFALLASIGASLAPYLGTDSVLRPARVVFLHSSLSIVPILVAMSNCVAILFNYVAVIFFIFLAGSGYVFPWLVMVSRGQNSTKIVCLVAEIALMASYFVAAVML